jgi:hypothetical protein
MHCLVLKIHFEVTMFHISLEIRRATERNPLRFDLPAPRLAPPLPLPTLSRHLWSATERASSFRLARLPRFAGKLWAGLRLGD